MITKQLLAYTAVAALCAAGLFQTWVLKDNQSWPVWVWLPLLGLALWALWVLRDTPGPKTKVLDFNPKRGILYLIAGFAIFPVIALINAAFGAELSLSSMAIFTLVGSLFAGLAGTFTENVGI